jgi:hypothetical protein
MVRDLTVVRHREGPLDYIEIAVRMLICVPLSVLLIVPVSFQFNIPTPGLYAAMKLVPDRGLGGEWLDPLIPCLIFAGFVNVVCFYVIMVLISPLRPVSGSEGNMQHRSRNFQVGVLKHKSATFYGPRGVVNRVLGVCYFPVDRSSIEGTLSAMRNSRPQCSHVCFPISMVLSCASQGIVTSLPQ